MLFRRNVTLPLLLTITVLATHPTVKIHLFYREFENKILIMQYCKHRTSPHIFWMFSSLRCPVNCSLPKQRHWNDPLKFMISTDFRGSEELLYSVSESLLLVQLAMIWGSTKRTGTAMSATDRAGKNQRPPRFEFRITVTYRNFSIVSRHVNLLPVFFVCRSSCIISFFWLLTF